MTDAQLAPLTQSDKKILDTHDIALTIFNAMSDLNDQTNLLDVLREHVIDQSSDPELQEVDTVIFEINVKMNALNKLCASAAEKDNFIADLQIRQYVDIRLTKKQQKNVDGLRKISASA